MLRRIVTLIFYESISAPSKTTFAKNRTTTTGPAAAAGRIRPKVSSAVETRASRSKDRTRQETLIKRCQSVEVLSVNDRVPRKSVETNNKPPPLPPKTERPLENILNTTLANDNIIVDGVVDVEIEEKKSVKFRPEVSATSMASLKKPFHKRRSSGLLFGVEERELPAPDTVKETRKIFESIDKTGRNGGRSSFLTKSQSTSSLYSSTFSRSPSRERSNDVLSNGRLVRKKSDENLSSGSSSRRQVSPQRRVTYVNYINNKSSLYRNNAATQKLNAKPSLPTKPTNLNYNRQNSADQESSAPVLPAKKSSISSPIASPDKKTISAAPKLSPRKSSVVVDEEDLEEGTKVISNDSLKNIRQSGATYSFSFQSENSTKNQNGTKNYLPNLATSKQVRFV